VTESVVLTEVATSVSVTVAYSALSRRNLLTVSRLAIVKSCCFMLEPLTLIVLVLFMKLRLLSKVS
jgi:hypothetical protein